MLVAIECVNDPSAVKPNGFASKILFFHANLPTLRRLEKVKRSIKEIAELFIGIDLGNFSGIDINRLIGDNVHEGLIRVISPSILAKVIKSS
jgi:hypothetical protein